MSINPKFELVIYSSFRGVCTKLPEFVHSKMISTYLLLYNLRKIYQLTILRNHYFIVQIKVNWIRYLNVSHCSNQKSVHLFLITHIRKMMVVKVLLMIAPFFLCMINSGGCCHFQKAYRIIIFLFRVIKCGLVHIFNVQ